MCRTPLGFKASPYWQELCVYMGQQEVFEQSSQTIEKLTGQNVCSKQIERMCHAYGYLLEQQQATEEPLTSPFDEEETVYGMVDGSMILTREDDWKEMKLGRIFSDQSLLYENEHRNFIRQSHYVSHLGGKTPFFNKLEKVISPIKNMVWVADGARWIWNWLDDNYPAHQQILDFYHASEKLHGFAREAIKNHEERKSWIERQVGLLKDNGVEIVMINVESFKCKGKALQKQTSLLTYFENNMKRMQYKDYIEAGYLIGSGPMESAHRTVIQQRMKLSGQRWTLAGAQQIANLRTAEKSGKWSRVINLICNPN